MRGANLRVKRPAITASPGFHSPFNIVSVEAVPIAFSGAIPNWDGVNLDCAIQIVKDRWSKYLHAPLQNSALAFSNLRYLGGVRLVQAQASPPRLYRSVCVQAPITHLRIGNRLSVRQCISGLRFTAGKVRIGAQRL